MKTNNNKSNTHQQMNHNQAKEPNIKQQPIQLNKNEMKITQTQPKYINTN